MSLVEQTPIQDELLSHEAQNIAPAESEWAKTAHPDNDGDPISAARGVVWGVLLGGVFWAIVLWVLL